MGRDPEDYLVGETDDGSADMTADASLLGYLQLTDQSHTSMGYVRELRSLEGDVDEER